MKYKATVEYRAIVHVEFEAENDKEADRQAIEDADDYVNGCLSVYDVKITKID